MMNKRILELAEHAELPNPHVPGQWRFNNQQLEFFAELIVRECCQMMVDLEVKYPANLTVREIKKHFGVEPNLEANWDHYSGLPSPNAYRDE